MHLKRCAVISVSGKAWRPPTFQCLCSLRTVSWSPSCSSCGRMSVSSSHAFKNTLSTRWSSWPKNSYITKMQDWCEKEQFLGFDSWYMIVLVLRANKLPVSLVYQLYLCQLTVCFFSSSSASPVSLKQPWAFFSTLSSSCRDSSNLLLRQLLASSCLLQSPTSFNKAWEEGQKVHGDCNWFLW